MLAVRPGRSSLARSRSSSTILPTKELEVALSDFEISLSEEQRKQFQVLQANDDSFDTNAAQILLASVKKGKDSSRRSRALLRMQGFLEAVQEFSAIVDSIAGINPIAAAVWGGVKLFIVYAIKFTHFTDDLTICLNQVQAACPRFKAYGSLYQSSQELRQAICDYYAVIFKFITKAISELDKSGLSAAWSYIKSPLESVLSDFKDDLTTSGENVNLYIAFAKNQADGTSQEEVKKHNSLVKKAWDQFSKREQEQRLVKERHFARSQRYELLKKLSDHDYKRLPRDLRKKALYGIDGPWLLRTSQYKSWATVLDSTAFLLSGRLGSGKSVLSTEVLDDLLMQHSNISKSALCFFFCDARQQRENSLLARTILGSLCRQYLQESGDLDTIEPALVEFFEVNPSPTTDEIAEFFTFCVDGTMTTHIVLDGLDDCSYRERTTVLTAINDIFSRIRQTQGDQSGSVKLFITFSLADDTQLNRFLRPEYEQNTTSPEASQDFTRTIDKLLQEKKEKGIWKFDDEGLFLDVSNALHRGSQNMLLWASLMVDEICAQLTITAVRKMIREDRLPKDLHGVYELALGRIEQTGCQEYTAKMFSAVAAARRPLSLLELAEIVVVEPCQQSWNSEDRIAVPEDMMSWVANLLVLDEEDRTVSFTHHSVVNFLTLTNNSLFRLSLEEADHFLGKICVTYLNFRELQGQLVLRKGMHERAQLQPVRIASTALSSAGGTQSWTKLLAKMTLKIRPHHREEQHRPKSTSTKSIQTLQAELEQLQSMFYLLAYASEFWLDHSSGFNDNSKEFSAILILWKKLLTSPLPAAARPWDPELWQECNRSLTYAITCRHAVLFAEILRTTYMSNTLKLTSGGAALLFKACAVRQTETLTGWSSENFWQVDWDMFLRSLNPDDYLIEPPHNVCKSLLDLRRSIPSKPAPALISMEGRLGNLFSAALLGAIENDYPPPQIEKLTLTVRDTIENFPCSSPVNYLSAAAAFNNVRFIDRYCDDDLSIDWPRLDLMEAAGQALIFAALRGSSEILTELLATQINRRRIRIEFLQVALTVCSRTNQPDGINVLLSSFDVFGLRESEKMASIEQLFHATGLTALMAATIGDHAEVVALLLQYGAPVDVVDQYNRRAIMYAKSAAVVRRLLELPSQTA